MIYWRHNQVVGLLNLANEAQQVIDYGGSNDWTLDEPFIQKLKLKAVDPDLIAFLCKVALASDGLRDELESVQKQVGSDYPGADEDIRIALEKFKKETE